ncbi:MAG: hypothetical protein R2711_08775 [Acidimicrobiales bacterium]
MFRVFRLTNGIYGQRQGGHHQMLRVRIPYGGVTLKLDLFGRLAEEYSRGWGHITAPEHPAALRAARAGARRHARARLGGAHHPGGVRATPCRNVMGCHLAGACPQEHLDITA